MHEPVMWGRTYSRTRQARDIRRAATSARAQDVDAASGTGCRVAAITAHASAGKAGGSLGSG
jgi:hypothetical protein